MECILQEKYTPHLSVGTSSPVEGPDPLADGCAVPPAIFRTSRKAFLACCPNTLRWLSDPNALLAKRIQVPLTDTFLLRTVKSREPSHLKLSQSLELYSKKGSHSVNKLILFVAAVLVTVPAQAQQDNLHKFRFVTPKASLSAPNFPNLAGMWDVRVSNSSNPPAGQIGESEFTFDVVQRTSSLPTQTLDNSGFEDHSFSNSICIASGTGNGVTVTSGEIATPTPVTFQINVDGGESYTMTGNLSGDGTTVTGTAVQYNSGSANCGVNDAGQGFTATLYNSASGTYTGSFTPDAGGSAFDATITLAEDTNFNLTGTVTATGNPCFASLVVDSSTFASFASGNIVEFFGTDGSGDLVGFIGNTGGSADIEGDTTWLNLYVTAVVYGGACNGQSYTDAPFHRVGHRPRGREFPKDPRGFKLDEESQKR
jgi:hypothetical protein